MDWKAIKNTPRLKEIFNLRIAMSRLTREFFWQQNFKEIETSIALKYPGQEPYLNPVPVEFHNPTGDSEKFYLRTSPEFALKKLLGAGYSKIFELGKCFRDFEQWGGNHNTEFTMLEFYRAPGTQFEIMEDIESLFKFLEKNLNGKVPSSKFQVPSDDWEKITMKNLWKQELGVDLDFNLDLKSISKTANELGFKLSADDVYEDVFYKIFLNKIEPSLGKSRPVFVYEYPAQMCSLSKLCKDNEKYTERFELYIGGLELANGFGELTDGQKQKELLEADKNKREKLGKETWGVDQGFIDALYEIEVEASGVALGFDRMVKLFAGARDLNEVVFQAVNDQVN